MQTRALLPLVILGLSAITQAAETLSVVPDSAQALATAGGRLANLDDASALRVSPANILQIQQTELLVNVAAWNGDIRFDSANGASVKMSQSWVYPASFYLVVPVVPDKLSFGFGVSTPYGMASTYPKAMDPNLRYVLPYESRLLALDLTPAVAFKVTKNLSVAAGMDIIYSDLQLKQVYPWGMLVPGSPDGEISMHGTGWGVGGYLGINWEFAKGHRLAFVGRLPVKVRYDGEFRTRDMPTPLLGAGFTYTSGFNSDMTFPGSLAVGYGVDVTDRLTLGFDFKWNDNSSHDDLPLSIGNNQALLGGATRAVFGWQDSIDLGFGATYALDDTWKLRCGYLYSENSQPADNYTPAVCVYDRHVFGVGVGWRGKTRSIDLAYAFVYNPIRTIVGAAQPAFDGNYKHQWHVLSLSLTQRF
ncbi:MAG: outer membrane protein transport protein [Verrucomicrobiaceae bacterium]